MAISLTKRRDSTSELFADDYDGNCDKIEEAISALETNYSNITTGGTGKTFHVDVRDFTAIDPTGVSDSTAGLTSAISQARTAQKPLVMVGGTYIVSTLKVPSQSVIIGTPGLTKIKSDGSNAPIIASSNYYSASGATVGGGTILRDLSIVGTNDQSKTSQHGVLLRDYASFLDRLNISDTGGSAIKLAHLNDVGTAYSTTLGENRIIGLRARNIRGPIAVDLGEINNAGLIDGIFIDALIVGFRSVTTTGYALLQCGNATGWTFATIDTYVSGSGAKIPQAALNLFHTSNCDIADVSLPQWTSAGIYIAAQTGVISLRGIRATADSANANSCGIYCDAESGATPQYNIDQLALTRTSGTGTIYGVLSNNGAIVNLSSPPMLTGAQASTLAPALVSGSGSIRSINGASEWVFSVANDGSILTTALQAAITDAANRGIGTLRLPAGTLRFDNELSVPDGKALNIVGAGLNATTLLQTNATKGGIRFYHSALTTGGGVFDLTIRAQGTWSATNSTGIGLRVRAVNDGFHCARVSIENFAIGIQESWSWYPKYEDIRIVYANSRALYVVADGANFGGGAVYRGLKISNKDTTSTNTGSVGICVEQTGGIFFDTIDVTHFNTSVLVKPPAGVQAAYLWFSSVLGDSALSDNWYIDGTNSGAKIVSMACTNCWAAYSVAGAGMVVTGSVDSLLWSGGRIRENYTNGVRLRSSIKHVNITGTQIEANSIQADGMHAGVLVDAGVSDWMVTASRIGLNASSSTNRHSYGVQVASGASNRYVISDNHLNGNATGAISDGGSGTNKNVGGNVT